MAWVRAGIALGVLVLVAGSAISGGRSADPPIPRGFPGALPAFVVSAREEGSSGGAGLEKQARTAERRDRRWLAHARPLGPAAPRWARRMYRRSLLILRALTDPRSGGVVAGSHPGWAYVWPRDAGAVAIAFAEAGYEGTARRTVRFLSSLELKAAARFRTDGAPVPGRATQGDGDGWMAAAARTVGTSLTATDTGFETRSASNRHVGLDAGRVWRDRADYQEGDAGDYLGNAIASGASLAAFETRRGLVRVADDPASGLDSAAAWAVRPFTRPALYPTVRRTLLSLVAERGTRFGIVPSADWHGGDDPWTAPTAWSAWSLATLRRIDRRAGRRHEAMVDRRAALGLMADLRRASTHLGLLPERVDVRTGAPASTTPLAWSHAFAILAIRALWPGRAGGYRSL